MAIKILLELFDCQTIDVLTQKLFYLKIDFRETIFLKSSDLLNSITMNLKYLIKNSETQRTLRFQFKINTSFNSFH
jgi:hypothetical protein